LYRYSKALFKSRAATKANTDAGKNYFQKHMTTIELSAKHMCSCIAAMNIRILQTSNCVIKKNCLHHFGLEVNFKLTKLT